MGLDCFELVMAVEERFGIVISDEEAQDLRTVGDMYRCVLRKVEISDRSSCLTQKTFHLLRRSARQLFNIPRDQFRPDAQLNLIVPRRSRRESWRNFQLAVGAKKWPRLSLSRTGLLILATLVFAIPGVVFEYGTSVLKWNVLIAGVLAFAAMAAVIKAGKVVTGPFEIEFRGGISTVRDLVYTVVAQNPELFGTEPAAWTADEIWSLLVSVIKVQTARSQFTKDSRFVEDLKID